MKAKLPDLRSVGPAPLASEAMSTMGLQNDGVQARMEREHWDRVEAKENKGEGIGRTKQNLCSKGPYFLSFDCVKVMS